MNLIIILAYGASFLEYALIVYLHYKFPQSTSLFSHIYNISLQAFLVASAALYVPIFISIKKLGNLASAQINKPQRFVALQLIVIASEKLILVPVFIYIAMKPSHQDAYIVHTKLVDLLLTPVLTQITYLCCNRRNVMALWKTLKTKCCKSNALYPNVPSNYMERVETTQQ
ncbi:hypothetical protein L3Y34_009719 [Caenorhabditis briggsae]|uniref:Uncharacterized protein n=1 Tax=Caenorhabditis briggsae TaxID=6238 RepID=A0AAE9ACR9_CAEBR|nr:hypothetical protein L3Y34_009719 [Caenorhabditis briggsae]